MIVKKFYDTIKNIENILTTTETTDNFQLGDLGKHLFGECFVGVFQPSTMPKHLCDEQCYILNTNDGNGLHWLGIYKYNGKTYCFDSYGRDESVLNKKFKNKRWINGLRKSIESIYGENCGQIAMACLVLFEKYKLKFIKAIN